MRFNLQFLQSQGIVDDLVQGSIEVNNIMVPYAVDSKAGLVYCEYETNVPVSEVLQALRTTTGSTRFWVITGSLLTVHSVRGSGEVFTFDTAHAPDTDYYQFKSSKLDSITDSSLAALFDTNDITSRFYTQLWELRVQIAHGLAQSIPEYNAIKLAQQLLDRMIAVYFLVSLGYIYQQSPSTHGRSQSARDLFTEVVQSEQDLYHAVIGPIFELLRDTSANTIKVGTRTIIVPHTGITMFEELHVGDLDSDSISETELELESIDWSAVLTIFNQYNWFMAQSDLRGLESSTVSDNPAVGTLTPAVLGYVYEKFVISLNQFTGLELSDLEEYVEDRLDANKSFGAYYTPESVTHYMAESTLFNLLGSRLDLDEYGSFEELINAPPAPRLDDIHQELRGLKIVDPSVGSGHFLLSMADVLFDWLCLTTEDSPGTSLRRSIVANNLYGVDLLEEAVEICKFRLWLWVLAAHGTDTTGTSLPDIDFNIRCGNSLFGLTGTEVPYPPSSSDTALQDQNQILFRQCNRYYANELDLSKVVHITEIDQIEQIAGTYGVTSITLRLKFADNMGRDIITQLDNLGFRTWRKSAKLVIDDLNYFETEVAPYLDTPIAACDTMELHRAVTEQDLQELKAFHWPLEFPEVFSEAPTGFDIIIGNPPYVEHKLLTSIRPFLKKLYDVYSPTADLYVYFVERGLELLNSRGRLSYIMSKQFLKANYGKALKTYISSNSSLIEFIDFGQLTVFRGLQIATMILQIMPTRESQIPARVCKIDESTSIPSLDRQDVLAQCYLKDQQAFRSDHWYLSELDIGAVLDQIKTRGTRIEGISSIQVHRGVTTGRNDVFIINDNTRQELVGYESVSQSIVKPCIQGSDITRNNIDNSGQWLVLTLQGVDIDQYPAIKSYLQKHKDKLEPRPLGYDTTDRNWKGRKPGSYRWYEIQDNTAYHEEFTCDKIVWALTSHRWAFAIDTNGYYLPSNGYILTSDNISLEYLVALLNSSLMEFTFSVIGNMTAGGAYTMKHTTIRQLPVVKPTAQNRGIIDSIIDLQRKLGTGADSEQIYHQLDHLIFDLYQLPEGHRVVIKTYLTRFRETYDKH